MHQTSPYEGAPKGGSGSNVFFPAWNLQNEPHLSICTNDVEVACHAFLLPAVTDMEAMGSPTLSHNMSYVAARAMFYLVAGARQIQLLNEMETAHTGCGFWEANLKRQIV